MILLKNIGKGILYIIGLPFFLVVLLGTAVFGLFIILFMFIKSILIFFTGRSLNDDLPEDIRAKAIKEGRNPDQPVLPPKREEERPRTIEEEVFGVEQPIQQPIPPQNNPTVNLEPIEQELPPFEDEPVEDEPIIETIKEEPIIEEKPVITTSRPEQPKKPTIGTYVPKSNSGRFINELDEDEEDDDDSGVIISYGDNDE